MITACVIGSWVAMYFAIKIVRRMNRENGERIKWVMKKRQERRFGEYEREK